VYNTAIKNIKGNAYLCIIATTIAFGAGLSVLSHLLSYKKIILFY